MPIIHLKIYEARLNDETEPKLIADFTQVLVDNFGEGIREHTTVILEGVKPSRWGVAGKAPEQTPEGIAHMSVVEVNAPGCSTWSRRTQSSSASARASPSPRARCGRTATAARCCSPTCRATRAGAGPPAGGVEVVAHPSNKGNGLSWDLEGRLLICEHSTSSLIRVEPDGSRTVLASHWQGKELNSPNDVVVTSDGSIVFTDPPYGRWPGFGVEREQELDFCGVYRIAPDGELLAARRRLPEAQRPVLLARREDALDQRHRRRAHPPLLRRLRRLAERRRGHLPDGGLQPRDRHPRRPEARRERQPLGLRPRRPARHHAARASCSAASSRPRTSATRPGAARTGRRSSSAPPPRCTRCARRSPRIARPP